MRQEWNKLPPEERERFGQLEKEDRVRFDREFDAWCESRPEESLGELRKFMGRHSAGRKRARPSLQAGAASRSEVPLPARPGSMSQVLLEAAKASLEDEREERKRRRTEKENPSNNVDAGCPNDDDGNAVATALAGAEAIEVDDLLSGFQMVQPNSPDKQAESPRAFPSSVDDVLGDLALVEQQEDAELDAEIAAGMLPPAPWTDTPQTISQPRVLGPALGPQLCIDESGNLQLNAASLVRNIDDDRPPEDSGPAQEAVSRFENAYKKTPPVKWTAAETDSFYEALSLYGTDLFLVQTFFKNKSAAQIKSKYQKELKSNPQMIMDSVIGKRKQLTSEVYESTYGKIDTSKHYVPPASPLPGERPEPDGSMAGSAAASVDGGAPGSQADDFEDFDLDDGMTEDDNTRTTNRLMALFD
jgi:hypothetical protein